MSMRWGIQLPMPSRLNRSVVRVLCSVREPVARSPSLEAAFGRVFATLFIKTLSGDANGQDHERGASFENAGPSGSFEGLRTVSPNLSHAPVGDDQLSTTSIVDMPTLHHASAPQVS